MHRCWLGDEVLSVGDLALLSPEESAHVSRVLRMQAGDCVQLIAQEHLWEGELECVGDETRVRVLRELPSPESKAQLTLVQGLPKADKLEWILQKATELGAWRVMPVEMERSVAKADNGKKLERWQRIVTEAAKQSGRAHVPAVEATLPFAKSLAKLQAEQDVILVAWEEEHALRLSEAVRAHADADRIALVIGPEGGISPKEVDALRALGAVPVTLGKRILRTETAGLCGLSVILAALGEM